MEEIYYKTLLRITLIHNDFFLKIKPRVEYELIIIGGRLIFIPLSGLPFSQGSVLSTGRIILVWSCGAGLLEKERGIMK